MLGMQKKKHGLNGKILLVRQTQQEETALGAASRVCGGSSGVSLTPSRTPAAFDCFPRHTTKIRPASIDTCPTTTATSREKEGKHCSAHGTETIHRLAVLESVIRATHTPFLALAREPCLLPILFGLGLSVSVVRL